jgi:hypothetical protein
MRAAVPVGVERRPVRPSEPAARAAGVVSGFDRYAGGQGQMRWRLLGLTGPALGHRIVKQRGRRPDPMSTNVARFSGVAGMCTDAMESQTWPSDGQRHWSSARRSASCSRRYSVGRAAFNAARSASN